MVRRLREQGFPARRAGEACAAYIRRLLAEGWLYTNKERRDETFVSQVGCG